MSSEQNKIYMIRQVPWQLQGVSYIVSKCHELWSTNGLKLDLHFTHLRKFCILRSSHSQARQPVAVVWEVPCRTQDSAGASTAEEGRAPQFSASELQADLQSVNRVEGPWDCLLYTSDAADE